MWLHIFRSSFDSVKIVLGVFQTNKFCSDLMPTFWFPWQRRGHNVASLDPLGIADADLDSEIPPELILRNYGLGRYKVSMVTVAGETRFCSPLIDVGGFATEMQGVCCNYNGFF